MKIIVHKEQEIGIQDSLNLEQQNGSRRRVNYSLVNAVVNSRVLELRRLDQDLTVTTLSEEAQAAIREHRQEVLGDIIDCNMGLIVSIAKQYAEKVELEDLKGVGIVTLLEAIPHFKIGRAKFSTFVFPRIRKAIHCYAIEQRSPIKETDYHYRKVKKAGGSSAAQTYTIFSLSKGLNQTNAESDPIENILPNDFIGDVEQEALSPLTLIDLMNLAQEAGLDFRQQRILWLRAVMSSDVYRSFPLSLRDIGKLLVPPVTGARVKQIEDKIKSKLCTPAFLPRLRQILSQGTRIDDYLA
ncbi:MAG: hypothetical protein UU73_C0005G0036 [Candidatus Daviesbacteria bacterium GW2011_GWA1_41_61]|uniref:RNA polymerase sigma-70 region 2 domain-containing protein n=1 Tax=Candidatus Daviesbacteria bacterium GW2011_GWA2_40_9 TaxID=1618424 RepID=A0A0G0WH38_9BACT|nr:MAG: hypothetical protein UU26_C0023G0010 [Candidatus Daviesbacteria bacterium GW2011_GWC1_40_9]KKR83635.1 MAG: hypothetical protein UU29_C0003G0037 [Candidatus Daviesbacteria bacterium GW2011_GWA2_40_9]KKR92706.1 MAG: hypothetical protein UU44_C0005G0036 [Candidatus Daviesbacteria bacterium GW2011_GWB1_41_15]KKS14637.1 MAG: hypothetical protein UU73_C0005G0036 [Candidatus Daviesbacteria bacterium GW2011_GWA1_41_61]